MDRTVSEHYYRGVKFKVKEHVEGTWSANGPNFYIVCNGLHEVIDAAMSQIEGGLMNDTYNQDYKNGIIRGLELAREFIDKELERIR